MAVPKIIVLDDDPTGSQTVHSCLLLTRWEVETLRVGLRDRAPLFFVLTNTRAVPPDRAEAITREVCRNLKLAIAAEGLKEFLLVSRSDSTLRGHYPIETDAIAAELGPFDAHFLVPAFFEGGRFTRDSIHYLVVNGVPTPTHATEFAKDSVFGYRHSYLPDYVAEKTGGRIPADRVERFLLADLRAGCRHRLLGLQGNVCCAVDAEGQADLDAFARDVLAAAGTGKRFLFRSAASLLTSLAQLPPQPIPAERMSEYARSDKPGAVLVGSHVRKTTEQLQRLLQEPGVAGIEVPVVALLDGDRLGSAGATERRSRELAEKTLAAARAAHVAGKTPVIFTSRDELRFDEVAVRLAFGQAVSALLMAIARGLPPDISFLIGKGGITSNDLLSTGLALPAVRLLGQIVPGCSVVRVPEDWPLFPNLPVVLFPGNVGDREALATTYRRFQRPQQVGA